MGVDIGVSCVYKLACPTCYAIMTTLLLCSIVQIFGMQKLCSTIWGIKITRSVFDVVFFQDWRRFCDVGDGPGYFYTPALLPVNLSGWRWRKSKIISGDMDRWNRWCWNENATSYPFPPNQAFLTSLLQNLGIFSKNLTISMNKYICCCCERLVEHYWALLKHDYSISAEFSYQIPLNQGFPDHHFELRELQGIIILKKSLTNFIPLRFQLNKTSNIYHSYQILISDSSRSRLPGSLLQTQGTSRYYATFLSQISLLSLPICSNPMKNTVVIWNKYYSGPIVQFTIGP